MAGLRSKLWGFLSGIYCPRFRANHFGTSFICPRSGGNHSDIGKRCLRFGGRFYPLGINVPQIQGRFPPPRAMLCPGFQADFCTSETITKIFQTYHSVSRTGQSMKQILFPRWEYYVPRLGIIVTLNWNNLRLPTINSKVYS